MQIWGLFIAENKHGKDYKLSVDVFKAKPKNKSFTVSTIVVMPVDCSKPRLTADHGLLKQALRLAFLCLYYDSGE